jgi:hypothetical protein
MSVNILNFDPYGAQINSPRSLEAMQRLGLDYSHLIPKTEQDFKS